MIYKEEAKKDGFKIQENKQDCILSKIKKIAPELIKDGELDINLLESLTNRGYGGKKQGYELTFAGKGFARAEYGLETKYQLQEEQVKAENKKQSKNEESTENIVIKGDNIDVLKILQQNYSNKIKMIYIDPPYNTGSDGFIYKDNFKQTEEDLIKELNLPKDFTNYLHNVFGTKNHSSWLSFMYPRLKLARDLLKEDGVIFISIDDNEQANLKLICDEIFGEDNFYGQLIQNKGSTQNDSKSIQRNVEYILCYVKNNQPLLVTHGNTVKKKVYSDYYLGSENGATGNNNKLIDRNNLGYTIYYLSSENFEGDNNLIIDNIKKANILYPEFNYYKDSQGNILHAIAVADYSVENLNVDSKEEDIYQDKKALVDLGYIKIRPPLRKGNKLGCWTWGIASFKNKWNNNEVIIQNNKNIFQKIFIHKNSKVIERKGIKYIEIINKLPMQNLLNNFSTSEGTKLLNNLFIESNKLFNNPKNLDMIKYFIKSSTESEDIILDFFAGSGTTGHAVMQLNAEDGGSRKFILVQLEEEIKENSEAYSFCKEHSLSCNISSITIERLNRAGNKVIEDLKAQLENTKLNNEEKLDIQNKLKNLDIGYKVFSLTPKPKLTFNEITQLELINNNQSHKTRLINLISASGYSLNEQYEEIEAGAIYKIEFNYYIVNNFTSSLDSLPFNQNSVIYLDPYAFTDIKLSLLLDTKVNKDKIVLVY